jgi:tRNA G18 (ribose-2'-O)-methylase SpoU
VIIYGLNPVIEAIRSQPERIHYVGVSREHGNKLQRAIAEAKNAGVPVRQMNAEQIDHLAGRGVHNGIVADVSEASYADFAGVLARETTKFVLILDGVTDPAEQREEQMNLK